MIIQSDIVIRRQVSGQSAGQGAKEKEPWASAQVLEKAQSRQGDPRESKPFPLLPFDRRPLGFAGFG